MYIKEFKETVRLDRDSEKMVEQSATFDPNDNWVHLMHDGNEISLNRDNWETLKKLAEKAIANLPEDLYSKIKLLGLKDASKQLSELNDTALLEIAKTHDQQTELNLLHINGLSKRIYSELFKRAGMGHKQIQHLSSKQRKYLETLGLKHRNETKLR